MPRTESIKNNVASTLQSGISLELSECLVDDRFALDFHISPFPALTA